MAVGLIQVASSFTSTPIEPSLRRALRSFGAPDELRFAMYGQMNQAMLAPDTETAGTLVLLRMEDWLREGLKSEAVSAPGGHASAIRDTLLARTDEFIQQISALAQFGKPVWFLACPSTGWVAAKHKLALLCQSYTNLLGARIRSLSQVTTLQWPALQLPGEIQDRGADRLGQIPFTQEAFDKLGEFLGQAVARRSTPGISVAETTQSSGLQSAAPQSKVGSTQLSSYLKDLRLEVSLVPARADDRTHIDRLLRSAATFSLTGEQRDLSDANIDALLNSGHCFLIKVSDRIADYGVTALVAFRVELEKDVLSVYAMAVSCAVLGKQVEFAIVSALIQLAADQHLAKLVFEYRPSERNQPMLTFLQAIADSGHGSSYVLPVASSETRLQSAAASAEAWTVRCDATVP